MSDTLRTDAPQQGVAEAVEVIRQSIARGTWTPELCAKAITTCAPGQPIVHIPPAGEGRGK